MAIDINKSYRLSDLQEELKDTPIGRTFKIKKDYWYWEFYDQNKDFFFIRNITSKMIVLIKKL